MFDCAPLIAVTISASVTSDPAPPDAVTLMSYALSSKLIPVSVPVKSTVLVSEAPVIDDSVPAPLILI